MGKTFSTGLLTNGIWQDASNNIGIGGSPSGSYKLEVTGTSRVSGNLQLGSTTASSTTTPITLNMGGTYGTTLLNGIKIKMFDDGTTVHGLGVIAGNLYLNATDGATKITLNTNNTERMTITSAGNVGIGVTPATFDTIGPVLQMGRAVFYGYNNEAALGANFRYEGGDKYINSDFACLYQMKSGTHVFLTAPSGTAGAAMTLTERMRITSGGNVLIGTSTGEPSYDHSIFNISNQGTLIAKQITSANNTCFSTWNNATSGNNLFQVFEINAGGNGAGSIDYLRSSSVVRFNTTSDANLKNIIGDSDKQKSIDILNTTRIREYSWKEDETNKPQIGVIAQELYKTFKGAVSKGSDDSEFGTEDYKEWGVDKTAFTFHLIAGWQKHEQMIQELSQQNQDLKSRLDKAGL